MWCDEWKGVKGVSVKGVRCEEWEGAYHERERLCPEGVKVGR